MKKFHTTSYKLYQPKKIVKSDFKVKIISDLHFSYMISDEKLQLIINQIEKEHPNYILFPGDLIDSTDMVKTKKERLRFLTFIESLGNIAPTFISLGSHDYYKKSFDKNKKGKVVVHWTYYMDQQLWDKINHLKQVYVLDNKFYEDEKVQIVGITQPYDSYHPTQKYMPTTKFEKRLYKVSNSLFHLCYPTPEEPKSMIHDLNINKNILKNLNPNKVKLALFHSPVLLENPEVASYFEEFDYTIHGHMHNGCIPPIMYEMFRSTRGLIAPNKKFFPKNERNTLKKKQDKMIVNGPLTVFQECTGFMQKFNLLFPTYTSTIEFTNDEKYNTEKVHVKRKYHK